jgi:hypothetical protein
MAKPHVPLAPGSNSLLDVPKPSAPRPFYFSLASFIPILFLLFYCITFRSVSVFFFFFFGSFYRSSPCRFRCLPSIAWLFSCPYHDELPPCFSLYGVNALAIGFFPYISFCLYSVLLLFFSLYFVCYLLVIMILPR